MAIDTRRTRQQLNLIRQNLKQPWNDRYPTYEHQKDRPISRPKLLCSISSMTHENNEVIVRVRIRNAGSGSSYYTKINFLYTLLAPIFLVPVGSPQPAPPPPVHEQLQLVESRTMAVHAGQDQELVFKVPQAFAIFGWQAAVICYDPVADPLPMVTWHQYLLPLDNLLKGTSNPPAAAPIPDWQEFDSPEAAQPRTTNRTWYGRSTDPAPRLTYFPAGQTYFAPGGSAAISELRQSVPLDQFTPLIAAGDLLLRLSGWVRSFDQQQQPPDISQMMAECLANDGTILAEIDLGQNTNTDAWRQLAGSMLVPAGTLRVRVRLRSTRQSGGNNDGYYDDILLTPSHRQVATATGSFFG